MLYQHETGKARNCPMFWLQMSESGLGGVLITVKKGLRTAEALFTLEEKVGFEPTVPFGTPDFESGTFGHSATSPNSFGAKG